MTSPRPPRAPLPDWSEGLREGTESLSIRPDDALSRPGISPFADPPLAYPPSPGHPRHLAGHLAGHLAEPLAEPMAMGTSEGDDTSSELAPMQLPDPAFHGPVDPEIEPPAPRKIHRPLTDSPLAALAAAVPGARPRSPSPPHPPHAPRAPRPSGPLDPSEDRTKVDVRVMRPRPPTPGEARAASVGDDGLTLVGSTLGSYRLLARIGKGGMGHVYRAEHVRLGREVALKLLRQDYAKRKDAVARFFQEARTVNRVRHRNIVDVTDFVELDDGTTFIIMELLTGQSLSSWVRSGIEVPRALAILAQICEGLAAAHSVNVIHRDLKPDNVIITRDPDGGELVKLLDFGVAKLINQGDDENFGVETAAGSVVGTPAYMSPEQAGGLPIDGRSDIYSLGAIMYELFCGQTMFRGRSFGEYVRKHLTEHPVPPRATPRGARLDPRIEGIILRAIEKEPSRRYQTVGELRDALMVLLNELIALGQSGQRRLAPLPGESGRMPVLQAPSFPPTAFLGAGQLPTGAPSPSGPSGHAGPAGEHAPLVDITMESEELSRSGARLSGARPHAGRHAGPPSYDGHSTGGPVATHLVRATPWYVWFVGGALAVGLGIGGATWYARSAAPQPPVTPAVAPALVEIRMISLPPGAGVFKAGGQTELCRTPCNLNLDPAEHDGQPVRPFIMRRDGYQHLGFIVDLSQAKREYVVVLATEAPAGAAADAGEPTTEPATAPTIEPATEPATAPLADATPVDPAAAPAPAAADAEPASSRAAPDRRRPAKGKRPGKTAAGDAGDADFELPTPAAPPPPASIAEDPPEDPPAAKPPAGKTGKIDRSETIDPFRTRP